MRRTIETLSLFPELASGLQSLLAGLTVDEWRKPTVHRDRDVKDLASHLLDTAQRRIAMQRDGWFTDAPSDTSFAGLVAFIQHANRTWMDVSRRLSPRMLVDQLGRVDAELLALLASLEPHGKAIFSVAWAGEDESKNWFDIAREYTERWHHQQQIRDAVGRPGLDDERFLRPVIATFARGLPHAYANAAGVAGAAAVVVDGVSYLSNAALPVEATIEMSGDTAWRLWTKGLTAEEARRRSKTSGREDLITPAFSFVAIMA